jgi:hypothetical protein
VLCLDRKHNLHLAETYLQAVAVVAVQVHHILRVLVVQVSLLSVTHMSNK